MNINNCSAYVAERIKRCKDDFTLQFYTASCAAGGSGKDTSNTAVRIIDKKTNLRASCEEQRSQSQNKRIAFIRLVRLLAEHYSKEEQENKSDFRSDTVVRSYTQKADRVKDHRTEKTYSYSDMLDGKLEPVIRDLLEMGEENG